MRQSKRFFLLTSALFGAVLFAGAAHAQGSVAIDTEEIGGVETGPQGPEAGVWVIAETNDLPTRYAKMALTDDEGRYVVPDRPKGKDKGWGGGEGLVESAKVDGEAGKALDLT